jgi:hypothetical protein
LAALSSAAVAPPADAWAAESLAAREPPARDSALAVAPHAVSFAARPDDWLWRSSVAAVASLMWAALTVAGRTAPVVGEEVESAARLSVPLDHVVVVDQPLVVPAADPVRQAVVAVSEARAGRLDLRERLAPAEQSYAVDRLA